MTMTKDEQDRIEAEASAWLVEREAGASPEAEQRFQAWLAADPAHRAAFDAVGRTWGRLGELTDTDTGAAETPARTPRISRRIAATAAALAVAATLAAIMLPSWLGAPAARYETALGEIRPIALPDGTIATLGARSAIDVRYGEGERYVALRSGEAFFEVAHDAARPFVVEAGGTTVRVVGTRFDVRRGARHVGVAVLDGVVEVSAGGGQANAAATLTGGERIEVEERHSFLAPAPAPVREIAAAPAGAWRDGRLAYDDASLADVAADLNRYYAPGVVLASRKTGALRVTASFRADEIAGFVEALDTILPVAVARAEDGALRIALRDAAR